MWKPFWESMGLFSFEKGQKKTARGGASVLLGAGQREDGTGFAVTAVFSGEQPFFRIDALLSLLRCEGCCDLPAFSSH